MGAWFGQKGPPVIGPRGEYALHHLLRELGVEGRFSCCPWNHTTL